MEEHEAHQSEARRLIQALREKNAEHEATKSRIAKKCNSHDENAFWTRRKLTDLDDRAKYLRIASVQNPSPIGQYSPNLQGPPAHGFYRESVSKLKEKSMRMLSDEAVKAGEAFAVKAASSREPARKNACTVSRGVASNFSPFQGQTRTTLGRQSDATLLGLRSLTHWASSRRPGSLPAILPRDSDCHNFSSHTANWMSRMGSPEMSRSRAHLSSLTRAESSPLF